MTGDFRFFAGLRSDPFFADIEGGANHFQWTGRDSFAGKNVFAIVLEVPNRTFGRGRRSAFGREYWFRTTDILCRAIESAGH